MSEIEHCHWCGRRVFHQGTPEVKYDPGIRRTRDHVIPKSMLGGRPNDESNIVIACEHCNGVRGNAPYEVFRWFIDQAKPEDRCRWRQQFQEFRFDLIRAGFRAAKYLAREAGFLEAAE